MKFKFKKQIFVSMIVVFLIFVAFSVYKVTAQEQSTQDLAIRLQQLNIPLLEVKTVSQVPYEVEIRIHSQSDEGHILPDDIWNMSLTRRQAKISHRFGIKLDSFTLCLVSQYGEEIVCEHTFVYAGDDDQNAPVNTDTIDREHVKSILSSELDFGDFIIKRFDVEKTNEEGGGGMILNLEVSDRNIEAANRSLPQLLNSIFILTDQEKEKNDINIIMVHLRVIDEAGKVLMDYVKDVETSTENWTMLPGVYNGWFSEPLIVSDTPTPTSTVPSQPYPAPESKPTATLNEAYIAPGQTGNNDTSQSYP